MRCAWVLACASVAWVSPAISLGQQVEAAPDDRESAPAQAEPANAANPQPQEDPAARIKQLDRQLLLMKKQRNPLLEKLAAEYRARPESVLIIAERDEARAALKTATEAKLAALRQGQEYRGLLEKKQQLQRQLDTLKAAPGNETRKMEVATACQLATLSLAQMERSAAQDDLDLITAQARVARAEAAVTRLQEEASAYALTSKEYQQFVQTAIQARDQRNAAETEIRVAELASLRPDFGRDPIEDARTRMLESLTQPPPPQTKVRVTPGQLKPGLPIGNVAPDDYIKRTSQR